VARETFVKATRIPASADAVFAWHEAPGAFERLTPPWERVRLLHHVGGIRDGARVVVRVGPWPFGLRWELGHEDYRAGRSFTDAQVKGPFRYWKHVHDMIPEGPHACMLHDAIEYELPLGALGQALAGGFFRRKLERLFAFRHAVTLEAFASSGTARA
jgi:ligand-binding SRPBCC domain-containing protein